MFAILKPYNLGRDSRESYTGRESFGRLALSSLETSTPIALNGTHDAKCSGMLSSGKR
jgi:hypothetical protein